LQMQYTKLRDGFKKGKKRFMAHKSSLTENEIYNT